MRFELKPKNASVNLRLPEQLLRGCAGRRRFLLEQGVLSRRDVRGAHLYFHVNDPISPTPKTLLGPSFHARLVSGDLLLSDRLRALR